MKVLFDTLELSRDGGKSIGIYNYASHLWRHVQAHLPDGVDLVLACHGRNEADFPVLRPDRVRKLVLSRSVPGKVVRQLWIRLAAPLLARAWGCSLYFSPKGFIPGNSGRTFGLKTLVVVHDLIPLWYQEKFPGYFGRLEEKVVCGGLTRSCLHADQVIAISEAVAVDICQRIPGVRRPVVVHNGMDAVPGQPLPRGERQFIFAMTSDLPHKNKARILEAYALYRQRVAAPLDMVVCGIADPGMPGVRAVKGISDAALDGYYRQAAAFVFLSLTEGFGFPPLEAMARGTPVLCSDVDVLRETTRGQAVFVDPGAPQLIADELVRMLEWRDEVWQQQVDKGLEAASSFSWDRCAKDVANLMAGLA